MFTAASTVHVTYDGKNYEFGDFSCLSSDSKRVKGIFNGSKATEIDTGKVFYFDLENETWLDSTLEIERNKLQDYLWQIDYSEPLDWSAAYRYFSKTIAPDIPSCSSLVANGLFGRNLDWTYSNQADVVVRNTGDGSNLDVIGTAGGFKILTNDYIATHKNSAFYNLLPFQLQDGINQAGLAACYNVVPCAFGKKAAEPAISRENDVPALMLVRFILSKFASATSAVEYVRDYCYVYWNTVLRDMNYDLHLMVADSEKTYIVEFYYGDTVIIDVTEDAPFMTNFPRYGVDLNSDNTVYTPADVPDHDPSTENHIYSLSSGLERFNVIANGIENVTDVASMHSLLSQLHFTHMYSTSEFPADPEWLTDLIEPDGDLTISDPSENFAEAVATTGEWFTNRDRNNPNTWITTHSVVYDLANKTMSIKAQEEDTEYEIEFLVEPTPIVYSTENWDGETIGTITVYSSEDEEPSVATYYKVSDDVWSDIKSSSVRFVGGYTTAIESESGVSYIHDTISIKDFDDVDNTGIETDFANVAVYDNEGYDDYQGLFVRNPINKTIEIIDEETGESITVQITFPELGVYLYADPEYLSKVTLTSAF